jgi:hypothetical protein
MERVAEEMKIAESVWRTWGLPVPVEEYRFHPTRRWKFDFAWPEYMIALEVEGGAFSGGRHTRGAGFLKDMEKYNEATIEGWRLLRCTPSQLCKGEHAKWVKRLIESDPDGWMETYVHRYVGEKEVGK